jgi:hypothetical protein
MPNAALNVLVKWAWSAKPAANAVSASGRASRSQLRSTARRRITEYRYGLVPQFHPVYRPGGVYPLARVARSFKTSADRITQAGGHSSNLRSGAWMSCMTPPR